MEFVDFFAQLLVQASDGRTPPKTSNATVTINIIRDESSPAFINAPYTDARVSENTDIGFEFYPKVQANDPDMQVWFWSVLDLSIHGRFFCIICLLSNPHQGEMVYEAIGDVPAPSFFGINASTGAIYVRADLKQDDDFEYHVSHQGPS